MYLKYVNTVYFVFNFEFASNTKYKIHRMYFKYVFEILYASECEITRWVVVCID